VLMLLQAGGYGYPQAPVAEATSSGLGGLVLVVVFAIGTGIGLLILLMLVKRLRCICRPNEILIFTGGKYRQADGTFSKTDVTAGGGRWRWPIIEQVYRMDITTMPIKVPSSAYSKGGIQLRVDAIANVKISSDQRIVRNAIERFLGRDRSEVAQVARQTLEGNLRGVLAKLTPEAVNEDRLAFAAELSREAGQDLAKLGLQLDTLKIQSVTDDQGYLESLGRKRIAEIHKEAEVAESDAEREAKTGVANSKAEGDIAREQAQRIVLEKSNESRKIKADWEAMVESEIKRTEAAAQAARALAEQELQQVRQAVERTRLQVEVIVPAEAQREAQRLLAKGAAAPYEEQGKAVAASLEMLAGAWSKAGGQAREVFLIQQIESLMKTVVESVSNIDVKQVSLIDAGDGTALPAYIASYPATVNAVLHELRAATGVDIPGVLSGELATRRAPRLGPAGGGHNG
jgi:flotillin